MDFKKIIFRFNKFAITLLMLVFSFSLWACSDNSDNKTYELYYKNSTADKLITAEYKSSTKELETLVVELLEAMKKTPKRSEYISVFPENLNVIKTELNYSCMNIYFDTEYNNMQPLVAVLFRAAVVKTVTQLEEIEYVQFYSGDEPVAYKDGTVIGLMSKNDFIDDSNDYMADVEWKEVELYFANKEGNKLVKTSEYIACSKNNSVERMIVEQIINGPNNNMVATLPKDVKLLGISVNNGVCYVNFSSSFLTGMVNVRNEIPIYSIVNSLCSLSDINAVRIMVNGDSAKMYRESISLDTNFIFNSGIIE